MDSTIYIVDKHIRYEYAYLSFLTNSVIAGFFEAFPYTGLANRALSGSIDYRIPVNFTSLELRIFLSAGAINMAPSNNSGFYKDR